MQTTTRMKRIKKIGTIPSEWKTMKLKEIAEFITKGATPTTYGYQWEEKGIPFFKSDCINEGKFVYGDFQYISTEAHNSLKRSKIQKGDILISITGDVGKVAIIPETVAEGNINQHVARIRINNEEVHKDFIYHWMNQKKIRNYYNVIKTGLAYPQISLEQVRETEVPIPEKDEQEKIVAILSSWDKAIELKEKLIKQKKVQKKGLMQKLLTGEVRLPGFKRNWNVFQIKDLSSVVTGTTPSTSNKDFYENGTYPWITPTDISDLKYISESERNLTVKGLEKGRFVPAGSLLVTCIASIGKNAILTKDGSCNQQINAILPSDSHSNEFLYYKLEQDIKRMEILAGKSATSIINKNTFEKFEISIPELEEQIAIAEVLSKIDEFIELSFKELKQLKQQKKGLMQLLLTGKVRV